MKICIISYGFPGSHNQSDFAFVKQLVDEMASQGHHCHVISPYNKLHYKKRSVAKEFYAVNKGDVTVYRPPYLSFSNITIGSFSLSSWSHARAVKRALKMMAEIPEVMYGHFWSSAFEGYAYAKAHKVPLFVASGESEIGFRRSDKTSDFCDYVSGVICVSSKNRDESVSLGLTTREKCGVFSNAVNTTLFRQLDRRECREKLGISPDKFVIAFVGWFNERKGATRVAEAIKLIKNKPIFSIFIGKGADEPDCGNILFKGLLPHNEIPIYLNAADVFVLPTKHEGCCNAVIEAMACGLPIVSSNLPFNWDVLDDTNSILIDPEKAEDIAEAICSLYDNQELRKRLSDGALKRAGTLSIDKRAVAILNFIQENF